MKALAAEEQNPEFTVEVQSEVLNREDNFAPVPETVAQSSSESDTAASKISSGNPEPVTESVTEAPTPAGHPNLPQNQLFPFHRKRPHL